MKKYGIDQLSVVQRLALVEEIWESIDAETWNTAQLSDAQRAEFAGQMLDDDLDDEDIFDREQIEESLAYWRSRN
jgi:putative addiction module component (TIGR02574 family)